MKIWLVFSTVFMSVVNRFRIGNIVNYLSWWSNYILFFKVFFSIFGFINYVLNRQTLLSSLTLLLVLAIISTHRFANGNKKSTIDQWIWCMYHIDAHHDTYGTPAIQWRRGRRRQSSNRTDDIGRLYVIQWVS